MEPLQEEPQEEQPCLERAASEKVVEQPKDDQPDNANEASEERDTFGNNSFDEMPRIMFPKQILRDYCIYKDLPSPRYMLLNITRSKLHQKWYTMELTIPEILTVNESAISKRMAEFRAATVAIQLIGQRDPDIFKPIPKSRFSLSRSLSMDYLSRRRRRRVNSNGSINTVDYTYSAMGSLAPSMEGMDCITENGDGADSLYGSEHGNKFISETNHNEKSASLQQNGKLPEDNQNSGCNNSQSSNSEQISAASLDEGVFVEGSEATSARSSALASPTESPSKILSDNTKHAKSGSTLQRKKSRSSSSILASIFSLGIWKPKPRARPTNEKNSSSDVSSRMESFETLDQPDNVISGRAFKEEETLCGEAPKTETIAGKSQFDTDKNKTCECRHFSLYGSLLCCNFESPMSGVHLDRTACAMLLKYCVLLYLPIPYYDIHFDQSNSRFTVTCRLLITNNENQASNIQAHLRPLSDKVREHRGDLSGRGTGDSLRSARNAAAEKVIAKLRSIGAYLEN